MVSLATGALTRANGTLRDLSDAHAVTPAQVSLAWLLHRSPAILPIPGTSSGEHLDENLAAGSIELTASELSSLAGLA
ncbi:aldo/keto reductase [Oerskovia sp. M15]